MGNKKYWKVIQEIEVIVLAESYNEAVKSHDYLWTDKNYHAYSLSDEDLKNYDLESKSNTGVDHV